MDKAGEHHLYKAQRMNGCLSAVRISLQLSLTLTFQLLCLFTLMTHSSVSHHVSHEEWQEEGHLSFSPFRHQDQEHIDHSQGSEATASPEKGQCSVLKGRTSHLSLPFHLLPADKLFPRFGLGKAPHKPSRNRNPQPA